jgi:hypothetical protein
MANAQVILKEKIEGLGAEADVVKVRAGYCQELPYSPRQSLRGKPLEPSPCGN